MDLVPAASFHTWLNKPAPALRRDALRLLQTLRTAPVPKDAWRDLDLLVEALIRLESRSGGEPSGHTLRAYRSGARRLVAWAGASGTDLVRMDRGDARRYLVELRETPGRVGTRPAPATVAARLQGARCLLSALVWAGLRDDNPFVGLGVRPDPTPAVVKHPPYDDAALDVLRALRERPDLEGQRLWLLTLLCLHAGLRAQEALDVAAGQLDGEFLVLTGKGGKVRRVPLSPQLQVALRLCPPLPGGRYFPWSYDDARAHMTRLFREAGLRWRGFHALRKRCATRLYEATGDFTRVAVFLGHSSVDTTRKYVQLAEHDVSAEVQAFRD